ncbi:hypothetical protein EJK54_0478 [Moraxella catarrhalis]|uniref:Uncharacterized protein n=1 Tax=Moraxella catarrhalis TaxID=480 RepID=A0ABY0BKK9_MORCA|nr:hypothetical protein EJK54_0478 [Moraxella catarrhalis]
MSLYLPNWLHDRTGRLENSSHQPSFRIQASRPHRSLRKLWRFYSAHLASSRPHRSLRKTALNATDKASVFTTAQVT